MKCVSSYFNTKTYKSQPRRQNASGFTIVELLIVIVVIAILAAITIVSYSGIQRNAINAAVQSALSSAATAMKLEAVKSGSFSSIPGSVKPPERVGLALTELPPPLSPSTSFCMNGTYQGNNDVAFHVTEGGSPEEGLCEGEVIPATVVGDYNFEAAGGSEPIANLINPVTVEGDLYGFEVATNKAWDQVTIRWDAQEGAERYEVMTTTSTAAGASWYHRLKTDGSGSGGRTSADYSGQISSGTTSMTWTSTAYAIPYSAGQTYRYRMRPCTSSSTSSCSDWTTVSLSNPVQSSSDVPGVDDFTVNPSGDWSSVDISWKKSPRYSTDFSSARYEIETATSTAAGASWYHRLKTDGSGSGGRTDADYSGQIPIDTTSLSWSDRSYSVPYSPGQTYRYRIRTCASSSTTYCGNWSTVSLNNPIQSGADVPGVTGFTVTPASDWSSITLSWNRVSNYSTNMPITRYEIETATSTAAGASWYHRLKTDGSGSGGRTDADYSGQIPIDTTSLSWSDRSYSVPYSPGQTYRYRIRTCASSSTMYCGNWSTVSLNNPIQSGADVPGVTGFTVTPASDWSSITLSWNRVSNYSTNMPITRYEIETATSTAAGASWYHRLKTDGSGSGSRTNTDYSGQIPIDTTSYTWTSQDVIPSPGQTYRYRIRTCASSSTIYCGNSIIISLSRPS